MKTKSNKKPALVLTVLTFLILLFIAATVMLVLDANHVLSKADTKKPVKTLVNNKDNTTNEDQEKSIPLDAFSIMREAVEGTDTSFPDITPELRQREYMLAESNTRLITLEDLVDLGKSELIVARNELYARYGYIFANPELTAYFTAKPWYAPTVPADQFSEAQFNEFEKANAIFITEYEKEKGFN